jgi:cytochrome c553
MIRKLAFVLAMFMLCSVASFASERIDFGRDVLPILSENCFYCHGQDGSHREADLRLDQREAAIANPTVEQLIATGFHRNHMINGEGGRIAEESRIEYVQDRVETTGTVWMGLTLTCCRCHDHKYDPFSQKQYYELAAYFNSIDESGANDAGGLANPVQSIATPEQKRLLGQYSATEQQRLQEREEVERKLLDRQADWEALYMARQQSSPAWEVPAQMFFDSEQGTELIQDGDMIVARGASPLIDTYEIRFAANASGVTAVRIEWTLSGSLASHRTL